MDRNIFSLKFVWTICLAMLLTGCYDDGFGLYGDDIEGGEVMVSFDANFEPFANAGLTRADNDVSGGTEGDCMKDLEDMCLIVYDKDGNLIEHLTREVSVDGKTFVDRGNQDGAYPEHTTGIAEDRTLKVTFSMSMPVGQYYIVAVANLGDGAKNTYKALTDPDGKYYGKYNTLHDLRNLRIVWDNEHIANNNAMLGYFNMDENMQSANAGSIFPTVTVSGKGTSLKCWLRRCASKITVDFDGSALRDNVYVYIKDVRVLNIVADCTLGFGKSPVSDGIVSMIDYNNSAGEKSAGKENADTSTGDSDSEGKTAYVSTASLLDASKNNQVITFGKGDDFNKWPCITNGSPYITDDQGNRKDLHSQDSPSLFFFENMQGKSPYPKVSTTDPATGKPVGSGNPDYDYDGVYNYDGVPLGTYIEVTAHYISTNYDNVGDSEIKYRFMIGKDAIDNCDAERNSHFKLTLQLRGNANDYDWHVDYHEEEGFDAPNPWYVSYVYNHSSNLPFKYTPPKGYKVIKMEAEIIENPWYPTPKSDGTYDFPAGDDSTPYEDTKTMGMEGRGNGFLSLRSPLSEFVAKSTTEHRDGTTVLDTDVDWPGYNVSGVNINLAYFKGEKTSGIEKHKRTYHFDGTPDDTNTGRESYTYKKENDSHTGVDKYTFSIPLFTREKILVKQTGYTGNNPFVSKTRTAKLKLTATIVPEAGGKEETREKTIDVIQVKRLVNPKGVYRKAGNNEDFHVVLMERNDINETEFHKTVSDGPWRAEIVGDQNFITLDGRQSVSGSTRSNIDFTIRFNKTNGKNMPNKNAIVRVLYNNYTCTHLIFVRQGYKPQQLSPSAVNFNGTNVTPAYWSTFNMIAKGLPAEDPRDEGSLFKFGNLDDPIDAVNNVYGDKDGDGEGEVLLRSEDEFVAQGPFRIVDTSGNISDDRKKSWRDITYDSTGFPDDANIASIHDFEQLYLTPYIQFGYGVLYADGATETQIAVKDIFGYYRRSDNKAKRGMRGVFAYYYNDNEPDGSCAGRNLFFPIGRSAYGHRKEGHESWNGQTEKELGVGMLRYCSGRWKPAVDTYVFTQTAPLFSSLYRREGAIYWANKPEVYKKYYVWNGGVDPDGKDNPNIKAFGLDLNYFTFDVNTITSSNVDNGADACFVRCVGN